MTAAAVPIVREVRLYGALGRQFGRLFRLAVRTPAEAVAALCAVLPGFERAFMGPDGRRRYHVYVGAGPWRRTVAEAEVGAPVGQREPIRFVPHIEGAKRGLLQTVIGATLIAVGFYTGNNYLVQVGVTLALGGVVQMLSPQRKLAERQDTPSYAYDGPINNTEQGGPVPVGYGRAIIGSVVVSQGLSSSELVVPGAYGEGGAAMPPNPALPAYEDGNI